MKRIIALLLALFIIFSFASCGEEDIPDDGGIGPGIGNDGGDDGYDEYIPDTPLIPLP